MKQRKEGEKINWDKIRDYIQDRVLEEIHTHFNDYSDKELEDLKMALQHKTAYWFGSGDEIVEKTPDIIDDIVDGEVAKWMEEKGRE